MKFKLNQGQIILLFLPFILGCIILEFHYPLSFAIANVLSVLSLGLIVSYQTYLVLSFNRLSDKKSTLFKINAYIPFAFFCWYFFYIFYFTIVKTIVPHDGFVEGPLRTSNFNLKSWIILFFVIHATVTFYVINNSFVAVTINKLIDVKKQEEFRMLFLNPLKKLTWIALSVFIGILVLSSIYTIVKS
ncbi:MAG: hypothetical protein ABIN91_22470 [Mucilaginibacter sp.]|uniref:hypothetical protein n=1 Tax=Mucilaginibacter sp. TaxID=1882438 RepID=UPI00326477A0